MTNAAAIGYAILAAKAMGLTQKQLQDLEGKMRVEMDFVTEEEAEEAYKNN
jgi:glycerol kinase